MIPLLRFSEQTKHVVDAMSIGTVIATIVQWLPPIAALISIIWGLLRIYESKTLQRMVRRSRRRNR